MDTPNQPVVNPPAPAVEPVVVQAQSANPEVAPEAVREQPFYSKFSFWAFVLLIINLVTILYLWFMPLLFPFIEVRNQPLGLGITIEKATVNSEGYIIVQVERKGEDPLTLASSALLTPDLYENLYLKLLDQDNLTPFDLGQIDPNAKVFVSFYKDSVLDNQSPQLSDKVARDIFGRKVQATFNLTSNDWPPVDPTLLEDSSTEELPTPSP